MSCALTPRLWVRVRSGCIQRQPIGVFSHSDVSQSLYLFLPPFLPPPSLPFSLNSTPHPQVRIKKKAADKGARGPEMRTRRQASCTRGHSHVRGAALTCSQRLGRFHSVFGKEAEWEQQQEAPGPDQAASGAELGYGGLFPAAPGPCSGAQLGGLQQTPRLGGAGAGPPLGRAWPV